MIDSNFAISGTIGGVNFSSVILRSTSASIVHSAALTPGNAGVLSTRTSDTEGIMTLGDGHDVTDSIEVDLFWDGGTATGTVDGVSGDLVTITGIVGVLPAEDASIIVTPKQIIATSFDPNLLKGITMLSDQDAHVQFLDADNNEMLAIDLIAAEAYIWLENLSANPFGEAIVSVASVKIGAGSADATSVKIGLIYDSI